MQIRLHRKRETYKIAFNAAVDSYNLSKRLPKAEAYSLTDQIRRSSRLVCANLAEAFRKRKHSKYLVSKLNDCEAEAAETQVWLDFALEFKYITNEQFEALDSNYDRIIGKLVNMAAHPQKWSY